MNRIASLTRFGGIAPTCASAVPATAQDNAVSAATIAPSRAISAETRSAATPMAVSAMVKIAWSSIRIRMTAPGAMPTLAASYGR